MSESESHRQQPARKGKRYQVRRREIIEAAERVFGRAGYWSATMADIAAEVDITQPALYRYFASKRELFLEALSFRQGEIQQGITEILGGPEPLQEKLKQIGIATEATVKAHPEMAMLRIQAISVAAQDDELRSGVARTIDQLFEGHQALVRAAVAEGSLREDVDPRVVAAAVTGMALFLYVATTIDHPLAKTEDAQSMMGRLLKMLEPDPKPDTRDR